MPQVVEVAGLTEADANQRAEDFRIDGVPVEIVPQADGSFTVRATYPDDVEYPGAVQVEQQPTHNEPASPPPVVEMTISPVGAALIKSFEGCLQPVAAGFQAYLDPVHVLTIGWGHTNDNGRRFQPDTIWTQAECDAEFLNDMHIFENVVKKHVIVQLDQNQFDALVSFTYNVGEGNLAQSTLLKKVNAGDFAGAAQEFARWNKAGGKVLAGLTRRRAAEAQLFEGNT